MNYALLPDLINGTLEALASLFIVVSCIKLHADKLVRGISWSTMAFFTAWGYWNLFYYPHLDQWISFWGGVSLVVANTVWFGQVLYYLRRERNEQRQVDNWVERYMDGNDRETEDPESIEQLRQEYEDSCAERGETLTWMRDDPS